MNQVIQRIFNKVAYSLGMSRSFKTPTSAQNVSKEYLLNNLINIIKENGYSPTLIIDVGANHGTWCRVWKKSFPNCAFIMIEPQHWLKTSFEDLLDEKTTYLPIGAGSKDTLLTFTVNSQRDDSSTFTLNSAEAGAMGHKQFNVPVKTLNTIIKENGGQVPDIIKIDAEGIDIEVLEGANDLWGKTEIFLVEANINGLYRNTDILKVLHFMDKAGYRMFDITDINRPFSNNVLWLIELAFVRKGGYFDQIQWQQS